jgi:hypothetical protein
MLFSKMLDFISYFFLPLLLYSIMLFFFPYEDMTHPSRDHIQPTFLIADFADGAQVYRWAGKETVCGTCLLRNSTPFFIVIFSDATLRLQKE